MFVVGVPLQRSTLVDHAARSFGHVTGVSACNTNGILLRHNQQNWVSLFVYVGTVSHTVCSNCWCDWQLGSQLHTAGHDKSAALLNAKHATIWYRPEHARLFAIRISKLTVTRH